MDKEIEGIGSEGVCAEQGLTIEQKRRIQKNKERARAVKEQRRLSKPYDRPNTAARDSLQQQEEQEALSFRDSHAGFMYDAEDTSSSSAQKHTRLVEEDGRDNHCNYHHNVIIT